MTKQLNDFKNGVPNQVALLKIKLCLAGKKYDEAIKFVTDNS